MKNIKIILSIFLIAILSLSFTACSLFGSSSDSDSEKKEEKFAEITIYNDENPVTYTVTCGERAEVDSFTKNGYYLTGYYTEKEEGTKYFTTAGESLGIWQETNPSVFYAQWKNIEELKLFEQDELYADTAFTLTSPFSTSHNKIYHFVKIIFSDEYINAIEGNLDKKVKIHISYKVKGWDTYSGEASDTFTPLGVNIVTDTSTKAEQLTNVSPTGVITADSYTAFDEERIVNAADIRKGCYVRFNKNIGQISHVEKYIKNLMISAEFLFDE